MTTYGKYKSTNSTMHRLEDLTLDTNLMISSIPLFLVVITLDATTQDIHNKRNISWNRDFRQEPLGSFMHMFTQIHRYQTRDKCNHHIKQTDNGDILVMRCPDDARNELSEFQDGCG